MNRSRLAALAIAALALAGACSAPAPAPTRSSSQVTAPPASEPTTAPPTTGEPAGPRAEPVFEGAPEPIDAPDPDDAGVPVPPPPPEPAIPDPSLSGATPSPAQPAAASAAPGEPPPAPQAVAQPDLAGEPIDDSRISPIAPAFDEGLEIAWWITKDDAGVGAQLARYADRAGPVPDDVRARWEHAGFRILAIDQSDVHAILDALPPVGLVRRDWIGRKVRWTECFRPPPEARLDAHRVVGLPHEINPGRLRFITRAWSSPPGTPDASPVLRVDLALQLYSPAPASNRLTLDEPTLPLVQHEGPIISDVTAELSLRDAQVLLITGERPGVVWGEPAPAAPDESRAEAVPADQFDPGVAGAGAKAQGPAFGPPVEQPIALGEAMLAAETSAIFPAPTHTIILLIPRVPDRFSLLP